MLELISVTFLAGSGGSHQSIFIVKMFSATKLTIMTDSAWEHLEATKGTTGDQSSRAHTIPGWNDIVKPYQGEAKFWYSLWLSAGKPIHSPVPGVDHDLYAYMKISRNQYHYAVRRAQNSVSKTENDKLVLKLGSSDLFEEIKSLCKDKNSELTSVVDDVHGSENISNHFKDIYEQLYNEQEDVDQEIIDNIAGRVAASDAEAIETINLFNADLVKAHVKKLKVDKSDVSGQFTSDCLKSAPSIFFSKLSSLFRFFYHMGISAMI